MTLRDDVARVLMAVPFPSQRTYELVDAIIPLVRAAERERCAAKCREIAQACYGHGESDLGQTALDCEAAIRNLKDE